MSAFTFADLFAGIGGFHVAFHGLGAQCVFACEIDRHARETYKANFTDVSPSLFEGNLFAEDVSCIDPAALPDFDVLCAGFPCQPFSQAGYKRGFKEERGRRGNMFFEVVRLLEAKRPKAFFLENVRHLLNHDNGRTFRIIRETLEQDLGYSFYYKIVKASEHGLPQHRPRVFMVGFRDEKTLDGGFAFPEPLPLQITMSDIFGAPCERDIGFTLRVGGKGSGIKDRRNWDCYMAGGLERRLTLPEAKRMMGFPADFIMPCSKTRSMEQLGNSVAVPAVKAVAAKLLERLRGVESFAPPSRSPALAEPAHTVREDPPLCARDPVAEGFAALLDKDQDSAKPRFGWPVKNTSDSDMVCRTYPSSFAEALTDTCDSAVSVSHLLTPGLFRPDILN